MAPDTKDEKQSTPTSVANKDKGREGGTALKEAGQAAEVVKSGDEKAPLGKRLSLELVEPSERDSWTVQSGSIYETPEELPGQVFVAAQLPDPDEQRKVGIDPVQQNAGLIVLDDKENLEHPSGLEPSDALLSTGVVKGQVSPAERFSS